MDEELVPYREMLWRRRNPRNLKMALLIRSHQGRQLKRSQIWRFCVHHGMFEEATWAAASAFQRKIAEICMKQTKIEHVFLCT